jgi:hypothetical protein
MIRFNLALATAVSVTMVIGGGTFEQPNTKQRSAANVRLLVLRAPQVGPGYRAAVIPGGANVRGQVTLDLCGQKYRSEALRLERIQLLYARPGSPLRLSNEVVRYRPGGTATAFRELRHAVAHCPSGPVQMPEPGSPRLTFRLTPLHLSGLLPHSIALQIHATGTSQGRRFVINSIVTYQARGSILSGVYTYNGSIAAQKRLAVHASRESAMNLNGA